jgi:chorismate dehydratase
MPIRVSVISYLNTVPFVYGLLNHPIARDIELHYATPSKAAQDILEGKSDIGIIPSAVIPSIGKDNIVSDYCIGAEGDVASVLLCSNVPLQDIELVYLDADSRTSVVLSRILFRKYWKLDPFYTPFDFSTQAIDPLNSYILIGDKALNYHDRFRYVYDLAGEWVKFTNLPFVFACWTSARKMDDYFIKGFNDALKFGISNMERAVKEVKHGFDQKYALDYLTGNISFNLGPDKRKGLSEFWSLALEELKSKVRWFG